MSLRKKFPHVGTGSFLKSLDTSSQVDIYHDAYRHLTFVQTVDNYNNSYYVVTNKVEQCLYDEIQGIYRLWSLQSLETINGDLIENHWQEYCSSDLVTWVFNRTYNVHGLETIVSINSVFRDEQNLYGYGGNPWVTQFKCIDGKFYNAYSSALGLEPVTDGKSVNQITFYDPQTQTYYAIDDGSNVASQGQPSLLSYKVGVPTPTAVALSQKSNSSYSFTDHRQKAKYIRLVDGDGVVYHGVVVGYTDLGNQTSSSFTLTPLIYIVLANGVSYINGSLTIPLKAGVATRDYSTVIGDDIFAVSCTTGSKMVFFHLTDSDLSKASLAIPKEISLPSVSDLVKTPIIQVNYPDSVKESFQNHYSLGKSDGSNPLIINPSTDSELADNDPAKDHTRLGYSYMLSVTYNKPADSFQIQLPQDKAGSSLITGNQNSARSTGYVVVDGPYVDYIDKNDYQTKTVPVSINNDQLKIKSVSSSIFTEIDVYYD